jgi:hypothetical protein
VKESNRIINKEERHEKVAEVYISFECYASEEVGPEHAEPVPRWCQHLEKCCPQQSECQFSGE